MFDFVRSHTRLFQFVLALLVFPSFIVFGIQGYSRFYEGGNATVAKVDGHSITKAEWDAAHQRSIEQMRQRMPNVDIKLLDTPEMRQRTLDELVRERTMFAAAHHLHLNATPQNVADALQKIPQIAALRKPDGTPDIERYKALLAAQGESPASFEAKVREDLTLQRVVDGVTRTAFAPPGATAPSLDALLQRREVQVQRFDAKDYLAKVNPTDADLDAYYKAHGDEFRAPEQAQIEYVVLDLDALKKGITVSDKDVQDYYQQNASRYSVPEERHAAHILIKSDANMSAADQAKAKAKAEGVLAELHKNPASFAELAKKNSDDPGSKDNGGDLGFFGRGAMVKPFEDAAFSLKPGETSGLVKSDFGYHIIKLLEARGGDKKSLEEVRPQIEDEVKKQLAQRKYAEAAETFTNTVYEQSDSLQPVVDKLKLEKKSATVQHAPLPPGNGPLSSQKFIDAVFGNDALRNKRNTEAVEFGPNQMASGHVVQYTPAHVLPLAEVKDRVRQRVAATQAAALARKEGEARVAALKASADAAGLPPAVTVSRPKPEGLPQPVMEAVMRADAAKLPSVFGVDLGNQGYAAVRLLKVEGPDTAAPELTALQPRYAQAWGQAETQAYVEALKRRYKAEIKADAAKPEAVEAGASAASR